MDQYFKDKSFEYNARSFLHDKNTPKKCIHVGGEYAEINHQQAKDNRP